MVKKAATKVVTKTADTDRLVRRPYCYVTNTGKSVRADILERYSVKAVEADSKALSEVDGFTQMYGIYSLITPLYSPLSLAGILELNTYHMRACKTKARDTAGLGWYLYPLKDNASQVAKKKIEKVLTNLEVSLQAVLDRACVDYESLGYGCVEVVKAGYRPDGDLVGIHHIQAQNIRIHKDGNKYCQLVGSKKRWFKRMGYAKDIDQDTGAEKELKKIPPDKRATEMVLWQNYNPRSPYYGMTDVIPALGAIHGDIARRDYNTSFFDNYGVPAYAVFVTGNFDPGVEDPETHQTDLEKTIEEHFSQVATHPHSVLVLTIPSADGTEGEVKVEFVPLAKEVKEASFRLYRTDNRDEVLAAHGIPPYRCGIAETGSLGGTTAQEATKIYKSSVIEPRQDIIEGWFNQHIIRDTFGVYDWEWRLEDIDTEDELAELNQAQSLFAMGGLSPNDLIRNFGEKYGVEPDDSNPAMDWHYIAGQPVGQQPQAPPQAPQVSDVEAVVQDLRDAVVNAAMKQEPHEHGDHVCYCPECNKEITVGADIKCNTQMCPDCNVPMRAKTVGEGHNAE